MSRRLALFTLAALAVLLLAPSGSVARGSVTAVPAPETGGPAAGPAAGPFVTPDQGGPVRRSLVVDGEYDAVRVPNHADLNPQADLTIELWVKHQSARGCGTLVGKNRDIGYWFGICDGRLRFSARGGAFADGNALIPEERWTHVAVTFDGSTRRFYVNGVLDASSGLGAPPLAANTADLVIGADASLGAVLRGKIDQVRLWNVVRSEAELADNRYAVLRRQPGLVAEWELDGSTRDLVGGHDGRIVSGGAFSFDGVVPRDVAVPLSAAPVALDGLCEPTEYGSAQRVFVDGADAPAVFVQTSASDVYVCVDRMPRGTNQNAFAAIYLDRDHGRDTVAQPGDYRFTQNQRGIADSEEGDGGGGYRDLDLGAGSWEAVRLTETDDWSAEFRIARRLLDRPADPDDPVVVGLAISYSPTGSGGDLFWPVGAEWHRPDTWASASLAETPGIPPLVTFTGDVRRAGEADEDGLPGATVQLHIATESSVILVDAATTDRGGRYALEYQGYDPDAFLVREIDPRGTTSVSASVGMAGIVAGPNLLLYEVDQDEPSVDRAYTGGVFVDAVGLAAPQALDQHYLIVYGEPVTELDLHAFAQAKRRQGFEVVLADIGDLERTGSGRDLAERIHNWLRAYWESVEPAPVYALLVGRGDKIPVRDIGWLDNDHRHPAQPTYYPAWPTDWYYADLDSDWDADGDRFYGEFMSCRPGETYLDPEDERLDCPESGSLSREGPFGALRSTEDDFEAEISVGRIALNEPGEVRRALAASLAAEASGAVDKRHTLLAGTFWWYEGRSWDQENRLYVPGGSTRSDPWVRAPWTGQQPYGYDSAEHLDAGLWPLVDPFMDQVTRLYETTSPGNDPTLVPSRRRPDAALTRAAVEDRWRVGRFGLVNVAGPGGPEGIVGAHWLHDWDGNRAIDNPAQSRSCTGAQITPLSQIGPPCWEIVAESLVDAALPKPIGVPPVVVANAGGTGAVAWAWDGVDGDSNVIDLRFGPPAVAGALPARGGAAAWVGTMTAMEPGSLDEFQDGLNQALLDTPLRLGDAVWQAMAGLARSNPFDMRAYSPQLFGDPALTYWGNPADSAGPWPQDGRDWRATSGSPYNGPATAAIAWTARDMSPSSPPAIGSDGNVVVGGNGRLLRFSPGGSLLDQASVGAGPGGNQWAPAVAADGAVLATGNSLYTFDRDLNARETVRLPGSASASGAPRIGPDGVLWVPTSSGLVRVTGAGQSERLAGAEPLGPVAFLPTGEAVWSTVDGNLATYMVDRMGTATTGEIDLPGGGGLGDLTSPAISAEGTIYVGSENGRLYALPHESAPWQADAGGPVRARPAIGVDGSVYVVNTQGEVLALAAESSTVLWRQDLRVQANAAPTVDGSQLYIAAGSRLYALNLATGDVAWVIALGGFVDERSVPVIGADRTLYVTRADQALVAVREAGWLPAPSEVSLVASPNDAIVRWRDNSQDETGFRVELCDTEGACELAGTTGADTTSFDVRRVPVAAGEPFLARVQAIGRAGDGVTVAGSPGSAPAALETNLASEYALSALVSAVPGPPVAPVDVAAEAAAADAIDVTWTFNENPGQLVGFVVLRRPGRTGPFEPVGTVGADGRHFTDTGLTPNTEYTYQVEAESEGGRSAPGTAAATTRARTMGAPTDLRVAVVSGALVLRWKDNAIAENGYVIERRAPGAAGYEVVGQLWPNATSFTDRAYVADGYFHYRVKAVAEAVESPYTGAGARFGSTGSSSVHLPWLGMRRSVAR